MKTADLLIPLRVAERKGTLETAARIQQRTTAIMRYAVQEGIIDSNPANDLTGAIAPPPKNHYPALPLEKIPECNQVNHLIPTRVLVKGGEITCKILK